LRCRCLIVAKSLRLLYLRKKDGFPTLATKYKANCEISWLMILAKNPILLAQEAHAHIELDLPTEE
jgi:hypothetical protein